MQQLVLILTSAAVILQKDSAELKDMWDRQLKYGSLFYLYIISFCNVWMCFFSYNYTLV
jgi:hypothetical protein